MSSKPGTFCRHCSYDLRAQTTPRCPECGRPFDPQNPRTYRRRPVRRWLIWPRRLAIALLILLLAYAAMLGWLWWGWKSEQNAIVEAMRSGRFVDPSAEPLDLPLLPRLLPEQWRFVLYRVLGLRVLSATKPDLDALGTFGHLRELLFSYPSFTDADMAPLARLTSLEKLTILDAGNIRGPGLTHLRGLRNLHALDITPALGQPAIDGRHLEALASLRQMENLALPNVRLGENDLAPLAGLRQLRYLCLHTDSPTAVSLEPLAGHGRLETVDVAGVVITDTNAAVLGGLGALEFLFLHGDDLRFGEAGVAALARSGTIREVRISVNDRTLPIAPDMLARAFPHTTIRYYPSPPTLWPGHGLPATTPASAPVASSTAPAVR